MCLPGLVAMAKVSWVRAWPQVTGFCVAGYCPMGGRGGREEKEGRRKVNGLEEEGAEEGLTKMSCPNTTYMYTV